jgi:hypothetical protein
VERGLLTEKDGAPAHTTSFIEESMGAISRDLRETNARLE